MTKKMLLIFQVSVLIFLAQGCSADSLKENQKSPDIRAEKSKERVKKYPPYPDVWDLDASNWKKLGSLWITESGDVAIGSDSRKREVDGKIEFETFPITFFEKKEYGFLDSNEKLKYGFKHVDDKPNIKLPANRTAVSKTGPGNCYHGYEQYVEISNENGVIKRLAFFSLEKEPVLYNENPRCADDDTFEQKVTSWYPVFVPLEDGTILVFDRGKKLIVRFNSDFSTKSKMINDRLYVVDWNSIQELYMKSGAPSDSEFQDILFKHLTGLN